MVGKKPFKLTPPELSFANAVKKTQILKELTLIRPVNRDINNLTRKVKVQARLFYGFAEGRLKVSKTNNAEKTNSRAPPNESTGTDRTVFLKKK